MARIIKFKCTRCEHTTEQYSYVKSMYHENCPKAKRGELGVSMVPEVKEMAK